MKKNILLYILFFLTSPIFAQHENIASEKILQLKQIYSGNLLYVNTIKYFNQDIPDNKLINIKFFYSDNNKSLKFILTVDDIYKICRRNDTNILYDIKKNRFDQSICSSDYFVESMLYHPILHSQTITDREMDSSLRLLITEMPYINTYTFAKDSDFSASIPVFNIRYTFGVNTKDSLVNFYYDYIESMGTQQFINQALINYQLNNVDTIKIKREIDNMFSDMSKSILDIDSNNSNYPNRESPATELQLEMPEGNSVHLSYNENKLTLLEFCFINYAPCNASINFLNELNYRYRKCGLKIIGLDLFKTDSKKISEYIAENKIKYEILSIKSRSGQFWDSEWVPTFYLINNYGKIIYKAQGYSEEISRKIDRLIDLYLKCD